MMAVIWKHKIDQKRQKFRLTKGAQILHVGEEDNMPSFWEMHESSEFDKEDREILVVDTGDPFEADWTVFIGTIQYKGGRVQHFFEILPGSEDVIYI
jgi:hypothetical protein